MPNARGERRPTCNYAWHGKKAFRVGRPLHYDVRSFYTHVIVLSFGEDVYQMFSQHVFGTFKTFDDGS